MANITDATWLGSVSAELTNGDNWSTGSVPPGIGNFITNGAPTAVTISVNATLGELMFEASAPAYSFTLNFSNSVLSFEGGGILNASSFSPTITITSGPSGETALEFHNSSAAGDATIRLPSTHVGASDYSGFVLFDGNSTAGSATIEAPLNGGGVNFTDLSSAGNATISVSGSDMEFSGNSTAGNADITNKATTAVVFSGSASGGNATFDVGGQGLFFEGSSNAGSADIISHNGVTFTGTSNGGEASFNAYGAGTVDFSGTTGPTGNGQVTAGSIAGTAVFFLGSNQFTVGGNNLSTTVTGFVADGGGFGGTGGSLVKIGTGTLTLDGANTYTGLTDVAAGELIVGNAKSRSASIVGPAKIEAGARLAFRHSESVPIDFAGAGATLVAPTASDLTGTLTGFENGGVLEFTDQAITAVTYDAADDELLLSDNDKQVGALMVNPSDDYSGIAFGVTRKGGTTTITVASVDTFTDQVASLSGGYDWSNGANWSAGAPPPAGGTAIIDGTGKDNIAGLSLAALTFEGSGSNLVMAPLTVGTLTDDDSGLLAIDANTTVRTLDVTLPLLQAIAVDHATLTVQNTFDSVHKAGFEVDGGGVLVDDAASDPGVDYAALGGDASLGIAPGEVILAATPSAKSFFSYDPSLTTPGIIALENPGSTIASTFQYVGGGDVLELPGTAVESFTVGRNSLQITTANGNGTSSYDFTSVHYAGPIVGYTAATDPTSGLLAITFLAGSATPTVTAIDETPSTGMLKAGGKVALTLAIDQPVKVTGKPELMLNNGAMAVYDSAKSTPTSLVFDYTVGKTDKGTTSLAATEIVYPVGTLAKITGLTGHPISATSLTDFDQSGPTIIFAGPDTFTDSVFGAQPYGYYWSNAGNWSAGSPPPAAGTAIIDGNGDDDIALSLNAMTVNTSDVVISANTTVGVLTENGSPPAGWAIDVEPGATFTIQDSFKAPASSTADSVNVDGGTLVDDAASDPGVKYLVAIGGEAILAAPLSVNSSLSYDPAAGTTGTFVLKNPGSTVQSLQAVGAGDVLELPGTTLENFAITTGKNGSLQIKTDKGSFDFKSVSYVGNVAGITAGVDPNTGLLAITFVTGDTFTDSVFGAQPYGYYWSNAGNWSAGSPPPAAGTAIIDGNGDDDIALSLNAMTVNTSDVVISANTTVGVLTENGSPPAGWAIDVEPGATFTIQDSFKAPASSTADSVNVDGGTLVDDAASDPGVKYLVAIGGEAILAAPLSANSSLSYDPAAGTTGTFVLKNPGSTVQSLQAVGAGDVLELPGTTLENFAITTGKNGSLQIKTDKGSFDFKSVSYVGNVAGITAGVDPNTGLLAITFDTVSGASDIIMDKPVANHAITAPDLDTVSTVGTGTGTGDNLITLPGSSVLAVDATQQFHDTVMGFAPESDRIALTGDAVAPVLATAQQVDGGADTQIAFADGSTLLLKGISHIDGSFFS